MMVNNAPQHW